MTAPQDRFVQCGEDRLHYVRAGEGEPLLLLHGAYGSGAGLLETPFGAALARRFHVVAPDSLGHGLSDAPAESGRYGARARADQVAAVLDDAGVDRLHVCGYSMGGWMASALATFHADRIRSLSIGGWDVLDGMYTPARLWGLEKIDYDILTAMVRETRPELLDGLKPERQPGLAAAINGMNDLSGLAQGVLDCGAPVAVWMGEDDAYYAAARRFAVAHGLVWLRVPGDHSGAIHDHGPQAAGAVLEFIERSGAAGPADAARPPSPSEGTGA